MKKEISKSFSRRRFLGYSALGLSELTILPSWTMSKGVRIAPSDRVALGFIGVGRQGVNDFKSFSECPGVQVVACCDVDQLKRERFKNKVETWQKSNNVAPRCDEYEFYGDLLERTDIDAVAIATPDHWQLKVARGYMECSDPSLLDKPDKEEVEKGNGQYEVSSSHMQNFIDAVRSRRDPIAPVEVGCSTNTLCCIANIATELQRPVKWNPATLSFGQDIEAANHRLYHYQYRNPYSL